VLKSKKGDLYAQGTLEDLTGACDLLVFPEAYKRLADRLKLEVPVLVRGGVRIEEGANPKLTVGEITALEDAQPVLPRALRIRISLDEATEATVDELHELFRAHPGAAQVMFNLERSGEFMVVMEAESYKVQPDRALVNRVEELCGRGSVQRVG
jgi:DNA polymerase-3 subunit alpha